MNKCHTPLNWQNDTTPALNETNLNYMDGCIETIDDRVVAMDTAKLEAEDVENVIAGVTMDDATGIFTFTKYDGSTFTIDTKLEKIAVNFRYDTATQKLIITLDDGTTQEIDLSSLIQETDFADSSTIVWTVTNHVATASIKANSIGDAQMQTGYLTDAQNAKNGAELAATSANTSRLESEGWAVGKQDGVDVPSTSPYYHNNAKYFAEYAGGNALSALTDVQISEAEDGQALLYNGTLNKWVNGAGTQFATLPVTNLTAVPGDSQVTLSWTNPEDVTVGGTKVAELELIKVYRDGALVERALLSTYTDTGLVNGQTYVYTVVAETTKGVESAVATISATPVATGLSVTLNGAKNDVISVYDEEDTLIDTVTFESGETSGTLVIPNEYIGTTLKFESSVAKGTTDATKTQNYVQRTEITEGMTVINVMPEGALYWYGNKVVSFESIARHYTTQNIQYIAPTVTDYTNSQKIEVHVTTPDTKGSRGGTYFSVSTIDLTNVSTIKIHVKSSSRPAASIYNSSILCCSSSKDNGYSVDAYGIIVNSSRAEFSGIESMDVSAFSGQKYIGITSFMNGDSQGPYPTMEYEALWLETSTSVTITLEGAKEDNITAKLSGTTVGTCIFASGQTSGTITLNVPSDGSSVPFVFESSIAKDTTSGTSNYTKTVNVSKDTTSVKVMPDGTMLYWYGNECNSVTGDWVAPNAIASTTSGIDYFDVYASNVTPCIRTKKASSLYVESYDPSSSRTGRCYASFHTVQKIDFSQFSKIVIDYTVVKNTTAQSVARYAIQFSGKLPEGYANQMETLAWYQLYSGENVGEVHKVSEVVIDKAIIVRPCYLSVFSFTASSYNPLGVDLHSIRLVE